MGLPTLHDTVANNVRGERARRRWTQAELAERLGHAAHVIFFPVHRVDLFAMVIRAAGTTKGTAVEWLARHHGCTPAEVVVVEPTGADTQVFSKIAGVEVTSVFRERHDFKPGATIRLRPDPTRAHLFDAANGARLAA